MRNDIWLLHRLDVIWTKYFSDVSQNNKVFIKFGRFARLRLGSIKLDRKTQASLITITGMFKDPKIPMAVIDCTIGHELVHYTHGFSSSRRRLFRYPHEGGVVKKEMIERKMGHLFEAYKVWMKEYREDLIANSRRRRKYGLF